MHISFLKRSRKLCRHVYLCVTESEESVSLLQCCSSEGGGAVGSATRREEEEFGPEEVAAEYRHVQHSHRAGDCSSAPAEIMCSLPSHTIRLLQHSSEYLYEITDEQTG